MSVHEFKLTGWQAIVGLVILVGIFGFRLVTLNNNQDADLREKLELEIMTEYFPDDVRRLQSAFNANEKDELDNTVDSILSTKLTIFFSDWSFYFLFICWNYYNSKCL